MVASPRKRGAVRKADDQRQDVRHARPLAVIEPKPTSAPDPDAGWLKATKDEWSLWWTSNVASAVETESEPGLRRLFDMRDLQRRAWTRYKKQPYIEGSQGQPVANPAFAEAMALERQILALEDRYGASPKAMANLGLVIGQAKMTAADLNRMAQEAGDLDIIDAELVDDEWESA